VFLNNRNAARKNNRVVFGKKAFAICHWEVRSRYAAVGYTRCLKARRKSGAIMLMSRHIVVCNTTSFVAFSP
jgi:hypothetical protein